MNRAVLKKPGLDLEDARTFVSSIDDHDFFDPSREVYVARAPGRLDLMGGIADYSGSLVLQWPLGEAALAAAQVVPDGRVQVTSLGPRPEADRSFAAGMDDLFPGGAPLPYGAARAWFEGQGPAAWAAYVLGGLLVLAREKSVTVPKGLRLLIRSQVPEGKGVSSSAALEVASMQAITHALEVSLEPRELAMLCQIVENRVVGAACGVMDQMTAACGAAGTLMALLCQPAELQDPIALPDELQVFGIDSGIRHSVSGSDYTSVRVGAFMGARILARRHAERTGRDRDDARPPWGDYLANITPSELESPAFGPLPETIPGAEFLDHYGRTADPVSRVEPDRRYAVRAPASHPVYEHFRVRAFAELLRGPLSDGALRLLGELMYQSHESYSACGLGSEATDVIVEAVRQAGFGAGFLGAKITGGGSGGTVAVLTRRGAGLETLLDECERRLGRRPAVFSGSSAGAGEFGSIRLGPRQ